jgi:hypothetical protein
MNRSCIREYFWDSLRLERDPFLVSWNSSIRELENPIERAVIVPHRNGAGKEPSQALAGGDITLMARLPFVPRCLVSAGKTSPVLRDRLF